VNRQTLRPLLAVLLIGAGIWVGLEADGYSAALTSRALDEGVVPTASELVWAELGTITCVVIEAAAVGLFILWVRQSWRDAVARAARDPYGYGPKPVGGIVVCVLSAAVLATSGVLVGEGTAHVEEMTSVVTAAGCPDPTLTPATTWEVWIPNGTVIVSWDSLLGATVMGSVAATNVGGSLDPYSLVVNSPNPNASLPVAFNLFGTAGWFTFHSDGANYWFYAESFQQYCHAGNPVRFQLTIVTG
jgi:hypothetical protein